jgi:hypothetical protein
MSAHTPGPWVIRDIRGGVVATDNSAAGWRSHKGLVFPQVAMVVGLPENRPDGEREANTRLIAAAPRMLAALEKAAEECRHEYCHWCGARNYKCQCKDGQWFRDILSAIAEAR